MLFFWETPPATKGSSEKQEFECVVIDAPWFINKEPDVYSFWNALKVPSLLKALMFDFLSLSMSN